MYVSGQCIQHTTVVPIRSSRNLKHIVVNRIEISECHTVWTNRFSVGRLLYLLHARVHLRRSYELRLARVFISCASTNRERNPTHVNQHAEHQPHTRKHTRNHTRHACTRHSKGASFASAGAQAHKHTKRAELGQQKGFRFISTVVLYPVLPTRYKIRQYYFIAVLQPQSTPVLCTPLCYSVLVLIVHYLQHSSTTKCHTW